MTALLRTTGTLLAARCGLRLQIAGMTAAHCEWSGEPVGSKRDGEKAAAAGAGADVVGCRHAYPSAIQQLRQHSWQLHLIL